MLENINPNCQLVSQPDLDKAVEQLQAHVKSKRNYIGNQYLLSQGAHLEVDWQSQNHRREYFSDCSFVHSKVFKYLHRKRLSSYQRLFLSRCFSSLRTSVSRIRSTFALAVWRERISLFTC